MADNPGYKLPDPLIVKRHTIVLSLFLTTQAVYECRAERHEFGMQTRFRNRILPIVCFGYALLNTLLTPLC